jgi:hypothetical protein
MGLDDCRKERMTAVLNLSADSQEENWPDWYPLRHILSVTSVEAAADNRRIS